MKRRDLDAILRGRAEKRQMALVTDVASGDQSLVDPDRQDGDLNLDAVTLAAVREAIQHNKSALIENGDRRLFAQVFNPPLRLILVGAVHIAQALAPMAALAGYAVTLVDPRQAFATEARFQGITLVHQWPDEALQGLALDRRTALVTLTHDPKLDDPALEVALRSDVFYIGSLGSKRTHGKRLERLRQAGFDPDTLERIHAPVGLNIGAKSPAEIAVSIVAEITRTLRQGMRP